MLHRRRPHGECSPRHGGDHGRGEGHARHVPDAGLGKLQDQEDDAADRCGEQHDVGEPLAAIGALEVGDELLANRHEDEGDRNKQQDVGNAMFRLQPAQVQLVEKIRQNRLVKPDLLPALIKPQTEARLH